MTSPYKEQLRAQLVSGVPRFRRRRRRRVASSAAVVLVCVVGAGAVFASAERGIETVTRTDPIDSPTTNVDQRTSTSTAIEDTDGLVSNPLPGGPALSQEDAGRAIELVGRFLANLRAGDSASASLLWSGYPETMGSAPAAVSEETAALTEQFRADNPDLLADSTPEISAMPSPGPEPGDSIVTVVGESADGDSVAAAFVLSGSASAAGPQIQRLPVQPAPARPADGSTVLPGSTVTVGLFPAEGGTRVFINGVEVASRLDLASRSVVAQLPDVEGTVVMTVSVANPEVPQASAMLYRIGS